MAGMPGGGFSMGMGMGMSMPTMAPTMPAAPIAMAPMASPTMGGSTGASMMAAPAFTPPSTGQSTPFLDSGTNSMWGNAEVMKVAGAGPTQPSMQDSFGSNIGSQLQNESAFNSTLGANDGIEAAGPTPDGGKYNMPGVQADGRMETSAQSKVGINNMKAGDGGNQLAVKNLQQLAPGGIKNDINATKQFVDPNAKGWATPKAEGTPQIKGLSAEQVRNGQMIDSAFEKAGFSENQRNALMEQVWRENAFQSKLVHGTHAEPNPKFGGRENIGIFSWGDPSRNAAFKNFMKAEGVMDSSGKMIPGQKAIEAQARFVKHEMTTNPQYARTVNQFVNNPNVDSNTARVVLGDNYIGWARNSATYGPDGNARMNMIRPHLSTLRTGGSAPSFASTQTASAPLPNAAYTTVGTAVSQALVAGVNPPPTAAASASVTPNAPLPTAAPGAPAAPTPQAPNVTTIKAAPTVTQALEQVFNSSTPSSNEWADVAANTDAPQIDYGQAPNTPELMRDVAGEPRDMQFTELQARAQNQQANLGFKVVPDTVETRLAAGPNPTPSPITQGPQPSSVLSPQTDGQPQPLSQLNGGFDTSNITNPAADHASRAVITPSQFAGKPTVAAPQATPGAPQKAPVGGSKPRTGVSRSAPVGRATPARNNAPVSGTSDADYLDPMAATRSIGPGRQGTASDLAKAFIKELGSIGKSTNKTSTEFSSSRLKRGIEKLLTTEGLPSQGGGGPQRGNMYPTTSGREVMVPNTLEEALFSHARGKMTSKDVQKVFKKEGWNVDLRRGRTDYEVYTPDGLGIFIQP